MGGFAIGLGGPGGGGAEALSSHLKYVQALREAAVQQQQQQDMQRQESFKNQLELLKQGAVPADQPATGGKVTNPNAAPSQSAGTLGTRNTPNPAAPADGTPVTEPISGQRYVIPKKKEGEEKLDDSNSIVPTGKMAEALEAAGLKPGQRIKPGDAHSILEAIKAMQPKEATNHEPTIDTEHFGGPVSIDHDTGKVTPLELGEGVTFKGKTPAAHEATPLAGVHGPKGEVVTFDKDTQQTGSVPLPKGAVRDKTEAEQAVAQRDREHQQDRQDTLQQKKAEDLKGVASAKADALTKAESEYGKSVRDAVKQYQQHVAKSHLQEPEAHTELNAAKDAAQQQLRLAKKNAQDKYTEGVSILTGGGDKKTSMATVQKFAKEKGISLSEALKQAKSEHYVIQGQ